MISILTAKIKNFRAIKEIDVKLDGQGMVVILGSNLDDNLSPGNGVGKTTLLSALKWGLFGESLEGDKGDDILPWQDPKDCQVVLTLSNGVDSAQIDRSRKRKGGSTTITFTVNGIVSDSATNKDVQTLIDNFLGFDANVFTILLTMAGLPKNKKPFLAMTDSEKKEFTDFILNLNYLNVAQDYVKSDIKVSTDRLNTITSKMQAETALKDQLTEQINSYMESEKLWAINRDTALKALKADVDTSEAKVKRLQTECAQLEKQYAENDTTELEHTRATLANLQKSIDATELMAKTKLEARTELAVQLNNLKAKLTTAKTKIDRSKIDTPYSQEFMTLPGCLQAAQQDVKSTGSEIKRLQADKSLYTGLNAEETAEVNAVERKIAELGFQSTTLFDSLKQLKKDRFELESQLTQSAGVCPKCKQPVSVEHINNEIIIIDESIQSTAKLLDNIIAEADNLKANTETKVETLKAAHKAEYTKMYEAAAEAFKKAQEVEKSLVKRKAELVTLITKHRDEEVARLEKEAESDNAELRNEIETATRKLTELDKVRAEMELLITQSNKHKRELEEDEKRLSLVPATLLTNITMTKQNINDAIDTLEVLKKAYIKSKSEPNPYEELKSKNALAISEKSDIIKTLHNEFKIVSSELDYFKFWYDGFGGAGLKSYILDSVTDLLNTKANYSLSKYSNTLKIQFKTQDRTKKGDLRDKFDVKIYNNGHETTFFHLSGGQQARVSIAVNYAYKILAEYYHNIKINFTFVDEALDNLDSTGVEKVINFLREELNRHTSIFVVSHDTLIKSLFDISWLITYEHGRSRLDVTK